MGLSDSKGALEQGAGLSVIGSACSAARARSGSVSKSRSSAAMSSSRIFPAWSGLGRDGDPQPERSARGHREATGVPD